VQTSRRRRRRFRIHRPQSPGAPPGTLVPDPEAPHPVIHVLAYGPERYGERQVGSVQELAALLGEVPVAWVNVTGLGDARVIGQLGAAFGVHPLTLEDVLNSHQRAKVEEYDTYHFIVAQVPQAGPTLETEQFSLVLSKGLLLTFEEHPAACLEPVRERIRAGHTHIRQAGADYLAYALLDAIIDGYFPILETYGERLEDAEAEALARPSGATIELIHTIKRDLLTLRRTVWPLREALNTLIRDLTPLITAETRVHLRDCYDHTVRIIDLVETYRELGSDLIDIYLSHLNTRTNEVVRVLTIIATIFIPLTFIAGVYGMNFNPAASPVNMPELNWYWGYPAVLLLMAVVAGLMLGFFWRRGWLRPTPAAGSGKEREGKAQDSAPFPPPQAGKGREE